MTCELSSLQGCYTFYTDPRALVVGGSPLVGAVDSGGSIQVGWFSQEELVTRVLHANLQPDDHCNPGLLLRQSDSRILAFYSRHVGPESLCGADATYLRISLNPNDPTVWGPEIDLCRQLRATSFGYANPVQLIGESNSPIYNFLRCATDSDGTCMHYTKSEDGGESWSPAAKLARTDWHSGNSRPYFRLARNRSKRIDFCINDGHPGEQRTNSVYHFFYEGSRWFASNGACLGDPPFIPKEFTMVFDGSTTRGSSWVWSIEIGRNGYPVIAYAAFPSATDHRYRYAWWDGSAWCDHEIVAAGGALYTDEPHYSGGICIDPEEVNSVFFSRLVGGVFQIFKATTLNGGESWSLTQLTAGSENSFRPYVVRGSRKLSYVTGRYNSYRDFSTFVRLKDISLTR